MGIPTGSQTRRNVLSNRRFLEPDVCKHRTLLGTQLVVSVRSPLDSTRSHLFHGCLMTYSPSGSRLRIAFVKLLACSALICGGNGLAHVSVGCCEVGVESMPAVLHTRPIHELVRDRVGFISQRNPMSRGLTLTNWLPTERTRATGGRGSSIAVAVNRAIYAARHVLYGKKVL
jgi:hypothetical protein